MHTGKTSFVFFNEMFVITWVDLNWIEFFAGIDPIQAECDDLKFKLDDMIGRLNDFVKVVKKEDKELFGGETEDDDKPRVIYLG